MFETHPKSNFRARHKLRILLVTESFLPQINGVTNSVCRVVEQLCKQGHSVDVIAPTGPDHYAGATVHRVNGLDLPGYSGFTLGVATRRRIRNIMAKLAPDVVHVASPFVLGYTAIRAANSLQLPVVSIYQTNMVSLAQRYRLRGIEAFVEHRIRRIHEQSVLNLVPSTASREQLAQLGVPRLRFWPHGVDVERFKPHNRDETLHDRLTSTYLLAQPHARDVVIGYLGRLTKGKDLHHLESLQHLPGVRLVIAGDGPEATNLHRLLPLARFVGPKNDDELTTLMATFDIFLHPGANETFCQAVQEAMASGVPVIGPAAGGLKDCIRHGHTGLQYEPYNVEAMLDAVKQLVEDPNLRRRLGREARQAVSHRSWTQVTQLLVSYYFDAIATSNTKILRPIPAGSF